MMDKKIAIIIFSVIVVSLFGIFVYAEGVSSGEIVNTLEKTVCCEKTNGGLFCQDVPDNECASDRKIPTSCESTSFCKGGFCFDSVEGTCLDNVPQVVCNQNNGTWSDEFPPQCNLGCCVLGDQASFVTLTRCKRLSSFLGLETNFDASNTNEVQCILSARAEEKGACVFEEDFDKTCKFVKRSECTIEGVTGVSETTTGNRSAGDKSRAVEGLTPAPTTPTAAPAATPSTTPSATTTTNQNAPVTGAVVSGINGSNKVEFFAGKLCSAEELGTNCGITKETICLPGFEEVYFVDTCGNPANIYDASKVNDKSYWANVKDKRESCGASSANEDSQTCGNCNYLLGSYCRESNSETANPTYGDNICASLNCVDANGEKKLHGESWCAFDSAGLLGGFIGGNSVGSKFYRNVCNNGEVLIEPCSDFRQEECIENSIDTGKGKYTQAACRVNRWQDCTAQRNKKNCENSDKRDCNWLEGIEYVLMGSVLSGENGSSSSIEGSSLQGIKERAKKVIEEEGGIPKGACVPENSPGLNFWSGGEAASVCAQANALCPVTYEKGLVGGGWKCVENCECLPGGELELKRAQLCTAMGDCGPKTNFIGQFGSGQGYKVTQEKLKGSKK